MKTKLLFLFVLAVFVSCSKNDTDLDEQSNDCTGWIDFIGPPSFRIALEDAAGNNLIANGTLKKESFSAKLNGLDYGDVVVYKDSITLHTFQQSDGVTLQEEYEWLLQLSEQDTDSLNYTLSFEEVKYSREGIVFCGTRSKLESASYNKMTFTWDANLLNSRYVIPLTVIK